MKFSENKNLDAGMKIASAIVLFVFGKKAIEKAKKTGAESDMDTNSAAGQAASLKQAMNPSGYRWMKNIDGTDKETVMRIASQISNMDDVAKHYKGLTNGDSLYDDLQGSLSPDEYQKFLSLSTKGKTGSYYYAKKSENVPFNHWVITVKEANVRRTPLYVWSHALKTNVVLLAPKGMKLGASTGKYTYDEKNKVLFVEFWTFTKKGEKKTYFVAKSQIEFVSQDELKKREKQGKIPLQVIEGLDGTDNLNENEIKKEVVSTDTAIVYDEDFKQVGLTPKNTIMGFLIMTLNTGKATFIKFETVQGAKRWIREDMAVINERKL